MAQKLLTISILVSGRTETTFRCLDSLQPLRDVVDTEVILVDTGCNDEMRKKLKSYATKIIPFEWCNDFSKARNAGLAEASGQWFLYLDDDEWFVELQDLIDFFQSGECKKYTLASYIQRNYLDMEGSQYTDTRVGRMARIAPGLHFESRIHEYLTPTGNLRKNLTATVEHYGYVYATEADKLAHFKRNQVLLEEMIKEEPGSLRWRLQLLQEYRSIDDYTQMEILGAAGVKMINESDTPDNEEARVYIGSFYAARILAAIGMENYKKVCILCEEAESDSRNTRLFQTFLNEMLTKAYFYRGLNTKGKANGVDYYALSEMSAQRYLDDLGYFMSHSEELYSQQIAPFVGECLDVVKQKELYSIRICNGLKLNQVRNLDQYVEMLRWDEPHVYVFEEIADILIEAMNRFAEKYKGKKFLENTEYAAYTKTLQIMHQHHALWEYFCDEIEKRQRHGLDMNGIIRLIDNVMPNEIEKGVQTSETDALVIQIKEQIQLLITNGMREQALVAIEQIKRLIPEDEQLQELEQMCMDDIK